MKHIRVFHPAGQPLAVQIASSPMCASPLKCLAHFKTASAGRAALNLREEIYKENVTKRKATLCLVADLNIDICLNGADFDARLGFGLLGNMLPALP